MLGLAARGYDVPRDFSVIGFDDVPQASFMAPGLTTIRQPRGLIGQHAMALMLQLLSENHPAETEILLRPDVVMRNSVGPPRQK